jgi:hypothetical protein
VSVVLDPLGRASDEYQRRGLPLLYLSGINDPIGTLEALAPKAVITGLSWPINLEQVWGLAANELGILLVHVEDFWGGSYRSTAHPDIIGVIDEAAARIACEQHPEAHVVLSGNPGVKPSPHRASAATSERVEAFRQKHGRVVLLTLGIEADVASFAAKCFAMMKGDFGIIRSVHPKVLQPGSNIIPGTEETYADFFEKHLLPWQDRIEVMSDLPIDDVAVCADMVVTGASTVLLTAAQAGVPVVSFWTPDTKRIVYESSGCKEYPPAALGMPCLTEPADLGDYFAPPPASLVAALRPYDPAPVVKVIPR